MTFTCPSILSSSSLSLTLIPMLDWFIHPYLVQPVFISSLSCLSVRPFLISSDLPTPNSSCPVLCQTFVALSGLSLFFIVCPYYVQTVLPCPAWLLCPVCLYFVQSFFDWSCLSMSSPSYVPCRVWPYTYCTLYRSFCLVPKHKIIVRRRVGIKRKLKEDFYE